MKDLSKQVTWTSSSLWDFGFLKLLLFRVYIYDSSPQGAVKERITESLVKDGKENFIHGAATGSFCYRGERPGPAVNTARPRGDLEPKSSVRVSGHKMSKGKHQGVRGVLAEGWLVGSWRWEMKNWVRYQGWSDARLGIFPKWSQRDSC